MRNSSKLGIIVGLSILQFGFSSVGTVAEIEQRTLFPLQLPNKQFRRFSAEGFGDESACGVIYHKDDPVTCGMPLGGIDTGCLDLETNGTFGYCTIFNTHIPRRGPLNAPLLGLSVGGKTWVLCDPHPRDGWGEYQPSKSHRSFSLWRGGKWDHATEPLTPIPAGMTHDGVQTVKQIHYWGHYPIADLEFETNAPVSVGLRAWSPFLPGDVLGSLTPAAVFEVHLRNATNLPQAGAVALTFPGPLREEAGATQFSRKLIAGDVQGVEVAAPLASYALGVIGKDTTRIGGDLAADASAWARIHQQLPQAGSDHAGTSLAVNFALPPRESKVLRFVLTWYAPTWNAGGYNWAVRRIRLRTCMPDITQAHCKQR